MGGGQASSLIIRVLVYPGRPAQLERASTVQDLPPDDPISLEDPRLGCPTLGELDPLRRSSHRPPRGSELSEEAKTMWAHGRAGSSGRAGNRARSLVC